MSEKEKVILIETILSFVEDIAKKDKKYPGPFEIRQRLRMYTENYDRLVPTP